MRSRVAHILAPAAFGGLESVVLSLTVGLAQRGMDCLVIPVLESAREEHLFSKGLRSEGISVKEVIVSGRDYLGEAAGVGKILRDEGIEVIHTHGFRSDVVHRFAHRRLALRRVSTTHGFVDVTWREKLYNSIQIRALRGFDQVIAVSPTIRDRLHRGGVPNARISMIPNSVSRPEVEVRRVALEQLGIPGHEGPVLGWVGRLSHEKGPDIMVEALLRMYGGGHGGTSRFVFVGDGPMRADLEARVAQANLQERVSFLGLVPGASRLFSGFDGVVLSSRTEGTPMVALEAMTCGIPVVATMVGGLPDLVREGAGYPVSPDDPAKLAVVLADLLANLDRARALGRAGRDIVVQEFSLDRWLDSHEEIYRTLSPALRRAPNAS